MTQDERWVEQADGRNTSNTITFHIKSHGHAVCPTVLECFVIKTSPKPPHLLGRVL